MQILRLADCHAAAPLRHNFKRKWIALRLRPRTSQRPRCNTQNAKLASAMQCKPISGGHSSTQLVLGILRGEAPCVVPWSELITNAQLQVAQWVFARTKVQASTLLRDQYLGPGGRQFVGRRADRGCSVFLPRTTLCVPVAREPPWPAQGIDCVAIAEAEQRANPRGARTRFSAHLGGGTNGLPG